LIRLGSIAGLPVIWQGKVLGRVEQAVLTRDGRALRGIVLRRGLGSARWAARSDLDVLGDVSVILSRAPTRPPRDAAFALGSVKDTAGLQLGRVTDVFLHRESLQTAALEISLGLWEDLSCGRMLARTYVLPPAPEEPGMVLIPCGAVLEPLRKEDTQ